MDRIVDHVLAFEGGGKIKDFVGNFSEYREWKKIRIQKSKIRKLTLKLRKKHYLQKKKKQQVTSKRKLSFKEQKELETIEKEMPELEKQRNGILEQLNNETDYEKISKLSAELESVSGN